MIFFRIFSIFFLNFSLCSSILNGNFEKNRDITSLPMYGCHWYGGSNAMVNCTCREDAEEFVIKRGEIPVLDTWTIEINKCKMVTFEKLSIELLRNLRNLHLKNIGTLNLTSESLNWFGYSDIDEFNEENQPSLRISIENSFIPRISQRTFKGRLREILIENCKINEIESFSFSSIRQLENLIIRNSEIDSFRVQSFKSFNVKNLIFQNVSVSDPIPSRSFSNLDVNEKFSITNSNFPLVFSGAFILNGVRSFEISETIIDTLDGEAFTVTVNGDVLFKNNRINVINSGALIKINPNRDLITNSILHLTLKSNFFNTISANSLDVNGLKLNIYDLKLNETCNCDRLFKKFNEFYDQFSEFQCKFNDHFVSFSKHKSENCTILAGHTTTIVIIILISILVLIVGAFLSFYYHKTYREGRYGKNDKNQPVSSGKNMSLIVPDGRTYRETEVHVILERADLLTTDL